MSLPYLNNGKWYISLNNGGTVGPFDDEATALAWIAEKALIDEQTQFATELVDLVVQTYATQKKLLIKLDTFAKRDGALLVKTVLEWNATHPDEQKAIPTNLAGMGEALSKANLSKFPRMNTKEQFAVFMQTVLDVMSSVPDDASTVMYLAMPLNSAN